MKTSYAEVTSAGRVLLHLPQASQWREIGWMSDGGRTFNCQRNPLKHLHHKSRSYGFNYDFLRDSRFVLVRVHLPEGDVLETTRVHILKKGIFLHFKRKGFEKQIFLSLSEFGLTKAESKDPEPEKTPECIIDSQVPLFAEMQSHKRERCDERKKVQGFELDFKESGARP